MMLLPAYLDDYMPENHLCRVTGAFTEQLDMAGLGYVYAECKETGCRPYDPCMMLNLYIYGYMNRVRSSRRLEAETRWNVEVMWLMEGLTPDDKTISNFRKENARALQETFRELGLYGGEVEATDGTRFRANNSRKRHHNRATVERELSRLDKQISEYLKALDEAGEAGEKRTALTAGENQGGAGKAVSAQGEVRGTF